ncbi:hypothetical protein [Streptomyces sp. NBC_01446]|uniref:Uncharacterized protein n=1 Tax=Streptomyces sp. NBC_00119 TaxID=2975659 RepID=A0AAU1UPJ0_9ACTN|nr:hypothetical protein [Streptomyces sp. NBC_01446]MCX4649328.1 hypothetical protein [Streptomyces sp. NBC_01446]
MIGVVRRGWPLTLNHEMQILSLAIVTAVIAAFCYLRERRQRELAQVRSVSEAAQRVVLRPLPRRLGPLKVASVYLAAEAEARIGGDLFCRRPRRRGDSDDHRRCARQGPELYQRRSPPARRFP